jgi:hypothetical protein
MSNPTALLSALTSTLRFFNGPGLRGRLDEFRRFLINLDYLKLTGGTYY